MAEIHSEIRAGFTEIGGMVVTPIDSKFHGSLLAVASTDENAHVAALEEIGIITSCRDGNVRISPHFYNNREDVKKIVDGFYKTKSLLKK